MMKFYRIFIFCFLIKIIYGDLPDDFDALMEKFFETPQCESFVADATYLSVATFACSPYTCDAPRQLCMRESNRYQDETANQCRTVPEGCLTAANGGIPIGPSRSIHTTPSPSVFGGMRGNPSATINGNKPPPQIVTGFPDFRGTPPPPPRPFTSGAFGDICQQAVPDGRFCGFQLKFSYNRETGNCEQFWFPGCATEKTNDNLFGDLQSCQVATRHCRAPPTQPPPPPPTAPPPAATTQRPRPVTTAFPDYPDSGEEIPPPPPPPPITSGGGGRSGGGGGVDLGSLAGSFMGGGGNGGAGGLVGQFLGGGLGGGGGHSNIGGGTPAGYGGGSLGGGGGGGGGGGPQQPNFIGLIANTIKQVGAKPGGGVPPAPGAGGGAQWLKNIDPQQITSIFSTADDLIPYKQIDRNTLCSFPRDVGHRKCGEPEWSHRFFFDFDSSQCRSFWYFGCGGNLNNFKKLDICEQFCKN